MASADERDETSDEAAGCLLRDACERRLSQDLVHYGLRLDGCTEDYWFQQCRYVSDGVVLTVIWERRESRVLMSVALKEADVAQNANELGLQNVARLRGVRRWRRYGKAAYGDINSLHRALDQMRDLLLTHARDLLGGNRASFGDLLRKAEASRPRRWL